MGSKYTNGLCVKKKKKREVGEEATEETSEKSEELEGKDQGAYKGGKLLAA